MNNKMIPIDLTVEQLLNALDGAGLIITDKDLLCETLSEMGMSFRDTIMEVEKG